jgi:hypothetical protein
VQKTSLTNVMKKNRNQTLTVKRVSYSASVMLGLSTCAQKNVSAEINFLRAKVKIKWRKEAFFQKFTTCIGKIF